MGQSLLRLASEDPSFQVTAAVVGNAPHRHVSDGVPFLRLLNWQLCRRLMLRLISVCHRGFRRCWHVCSARCAAGLWDDWSRFEAA